MAHQCPKRGCTRQVADHMLACKLHWYQVPADIRSWVWNAWAGGAGAGTRDHLEAINAAVRAMNEPVPS